MEVAETAEVERKLTAVEVATETQSEDVRGQHEHARR